jgi:hypothetical protein
MRISQRDLEVLTNRLNEKAGFKNPQYNTPDSYQLSGAYGGWKLEKVCNEAGGVSTVSHGGYMPKRELYNQLQTLLYF